MDALSVHPSCTQFASDGSKVTLHPNIAILPKVIPSDYSSMVMELLRFYTPPFPCAQCVRCILTLSANRM